MHAKFMLYANVVSHFLNAHAQPGVVFILNICIFEIHLHFVIICKKKRDNFRSLELRET